jgi:DNA topoisomerase-1
MTLDPVKSARSARLRYVNDGRRGIRRKMGALGFRYFRPDGRPIRNASELKRIATLAIPPAWTEVWICPDPRGHLQATGRDAKGRKQYRYHSAWRAARDETKYERMLAFAAQLPRLRARISRELARPRLSREKVLATVVRLLETSLIRVGNEEYARANGSFGLTTLKDKHVNVRGSRLCFEFRGKSGKRHSVNVNDRRLAGIVRQCRDLPGQELFQYMDDEGHRRKVDSGDVNRYVKEITGDDFTAKDFRTWAGTVLACVALRERCDGDGRTAPRNKDVLEAIDAVAGLLGNTRTVCRKSYIHPAIVESYLDGTMRAICQRYAKNNGRRTRGRLSADEEAAVAVLRHAAQSGRRKAA